MNTRLLVLISFLLALLCHLFIFNYVTIIFPIDPETPKPKFFFLGPILKPGDIKEILSKGFTPKSYDNQDHRYSFGNDTTPMHYETTDPDKNPFLIKSIKKPLVPQTIQSEKKISFKPISEIQLEGDIPKKVETEPFKKELEIQPYKPLRFRAPKNKSPKI